MNIRGPLGLKAPKPIRGTVAAKAHLARVKSLPCVICGAPPPSDAHHVISGRFGSIRASDFDTIPLCKAHHQNGPDAIHQDKAAWEAKHGFDTDYLPIVAALLPHPLTAAAARRHNRED
jgi:hypothetical protein